MKVTLLTLEPNLISPMMLLLEEGEVKLMIIMKEIVDMLRQETNGGEKLKPGAPIEDARGLLNRWAESLKGVVK